VNDVGEPFYKLIQGDCLKVLPTLPPESQDLAIIDPPYNMLAIGWDKQQVNLKLLSKELKRVMKYNGTVYIFCQSPIMFKIYNVFNHDFKFRQDLVWSKNRAIGLYDSMFVRSHENILYFVRDKNELLIEFGKYIKGKRLERKLTLRDLGNLCGEKWYHRGGTFYFETGLSCPNLTQYEKLKEVLKLNDKFDCLVEKAVFASTDIALKGEPYKTYRKGHGKLYGVQSSLKEYTQNNKGTRKARSVLSYSIIQNGQEYLGHPTQKPEALIKYLIKASSQIGDNVLDLFAGTGTTMKACQELERSCTSIELEKKYCTIIKRRCFGQSFLDHKADYQFATLNIISSLTP
jgi:site-specific DNA-methyltransferase (adenine-specific)